METKKAVGVEKYRFYSREGSSSRAFASKFTGLHQNLYAFTQS